MLLVCSPKLDPEAMRVSTVPMDKEILDEQTKEAQS